MTTFIERYGLVQYRDGAHPLNKDGMTCELEGLGATGRFNACYTKDIRVMYNYPPTLHFDHCTKHGWVRGLLCPFHNYGIGFPAEGFEPSFKMLLTVRDVDAPTGWRWPDEIKLYLDNCPDCKNTNHLMTADYTDKASLYPQAHEEES